MKIKSLFVLFTVLAVAFSCTNDSASPTGRLTVQLTDAPFPHDLVAEANVTIFKIDARMKGDGLAAPMDGVANTEADGGPFIVLMEEEIPVNLLQLTNGLTETLVDMEVPVGSFDLIRVYVKGVGIVMNDGTTHDLNVPSGEQTGIKVFITPELVVNGGLTSDLLLDFDVSQSFVAMGNPNDVMGITGFNFKPVIKASNMSIAGTLTGRVTTLEGDVAVGLAGARISVDSGDNLKTAEADGDGNYTVLGLDAGSHTVVAEMTGYQMQTIVDLEIVAGNQTVQDFALEAQ
ncbi:MAG: DUF4382 domain-containing protein [Maribacter sp.]|nr:DUF4382 domain-containing protein [Maribacter sp.]